MRKRDEDRRNGRKWAENGWSMDAWDESDSTTNRIKKRGLKME